MKRWFLLKFSPNGFRCLPPRPFGDIYRSISILPYVQSHYYPVIDKNVDKLVSKSEYDSISPQSKY